MDKAPRRRAPHVIRVRDTGIGIAANQQSRIFDMFTQGDTALERAVTGLGIGLTLVKTLTQMHGGTVDVTSAGIGQAVCGLSHTRACLRTDVRVDVRLDTG